MTEQAQRFKNLLKALKINQLQLSKSIEVHYSQTNAIYNGRGDLSRGYLNKLGKKYPSINTHWLITGIGDMFLPSIPDGIDMVNEPLEKYRINVPNQVDDDAIMRQVLAKNLLVLAKRWGLKKNELAQVLVPGSKKPTVTNYFSGKSQLPLFALVRLEDLTGIGLSTWITHELQERELPFEPIQARKGGADQLEDIKAGLRALLNKL